MRRIIRLLVSMAAWIAWIPGSRATELDCQGPLGPLRLTVVIENVRSRAGLIDVTVYPDEPQRFMKAGGPIRTLSGLGAPAETPVTQMCVWLPSPGAYAISVYHDANGNRDFDQNFLGLPAEGFGFSNNPTTLVGPPTFEAARFLVTNGDMTINIRLRYLG